MCRCLWYARGLCLCPCVITPRGFTSPPTQDEYSFSGVYSNKQTESARRLKPLLVSFQIDVTFYNFGRIVWLTFRINFRIPNWTASNSGTSTKTVIFFSTIILLLFKSNLFLSRCRDLRERKRLLLYNRSMIVPKKSFVERNRANMKRGRLGKSFPDKRGIPFYYVKIGFLKYLPLSGEIRVLNAPISYRKKLTIWKEVSVVQVGAVIHEYQGEGAIWSRKCQWWKDWPGQWAQLSTDNVNFCQQSCPYQREACSTIRPGPRIP